MYMYASSTTEQKERGDRITQSNQQPLVGYSSLFFPPVVLVFPLSVDPVVRSRADFLSVSALTT